MLVTVFVGLLTIIEKVWTIGMGVYRQFYVWLQWPTDRKVFQFLKNNNHGHVYGVKEISEALGKKQRTVAGSLLRLAAKNKAQALDDGLWSMHDFEA